VDCQALGNRRGQTVKSLLRGGALARVFTYFNVNAFDLYRIRVRSLRLAFFFFNFKTKLAA